MEIGFELSVQITGTLTIKLKDLTRGFFPDIVINFANRNFLITSGGPGTPTGLPAGIYIYQQINIAAIFQAIIDNIGGILGAIGIPTPKLPSLGVDMGLFLTTEAVGFSFKTSIIEVK